MRVTEFVNSYFDAWNDWDPEGVADHLNPDGIYVDVYENVQRNHDQLVIALDQFFETNRLRYELIGDVLSGPGTIAFQYRVYPSGKRCDGQSVCQGAEFVTLQGSAATSIADYYEYAETAALSDANAAQRDRKYAKSGLSETQLLRYKGQLERMMSQEQAYLKLNLTLPALAKSLGCSVNHLSQVINSGFGMSFFEYVNQYRIAHARSLLANPDSRKDAILNIAFTVGFNSNSAFYAAFKKRVGQTPAQYRRAQLST